MKNTNDSIIKNYVKDVLQLIPGTYHRRLKKELQGCISERFHSIPELTDSMIYERFGTPESFAADYLSGMDAEELQTTLARSKKHKRILTIALIALLLLLIPISIWICSEGERHRGYYSSEKIIDHGIQ